MQIGLNGGEAGDAIPGLRNTEPISSCIDNDMHRVAVMARLDAAISPAAVHYAFWLLMAGSRPGMTIESGESPSMRLRISLRDRLFARPRPTADASALRTDISN
jgi:hypothetical protein